jgi:hypothetical protein
MPGDSVAPLELSALVRRFSCSPCSRCGSRVETGYAGLLSFEVGSGSFVPIASGAVVLCEECNHDLEESVGSYGEGAEQRRARFLARLEALRPSG